MIGDFVEFLAKGSGWGDKLAKAKLAINLAEAQARSKTREAMTAFANDLAPGQAVGLQAKIDAHLDKILAASSQSSAVREVLTVFGVDTFRWLADWLERKGETK